jgi:hypothetical protein
MDVKEKAYWDLATIEKRRQNACRDLATKARNLFFVK